MVFPIPKPSPNAVPVVFSLAQRRGVTIGINRRPNFCAWAVLGADGELIVGPRQGENINPGDTDLAHLIEGAVKEVGGASEVYVLDHRLSEIMAHGKEKLTVLSSSPPFGARAKIDTALEKRSKKLCSSIIVFTDASKGSGSTLGTGWTISYNNGPGPLFGSASHTSPVGVSGAEIIAISDALKDVAFMHPTLMDDASFKVEIRSDSQQALRVAEDLISGEGIPYPSQPALREAYRTIEQSSKRIKLRTTWVRGHNGDPGNEAADRLAVNARRVVELETPRNVAMALLREIINTERPNLRAA